MSTSKMAKKRRRKSGFSADEIIRTMLTFQIVTDRSRYFDLIEETPYSRTDLKYSGRMQRAVSRIKRFSKTEAAMGD